MDFLLPAQMCVALPLIVAAAGAARLADDSSQWSKDLAFVDPSQQLPMDPANVWEFLEQPLHRPLPVGAVLFEKLRLDAVTTQLAQNCLIASSSTEYLASRITTVGPVAWHSCLLFTHRGTGGDGEKGREVGVWGREGVQAVVLEGGQNCHRSAWHATLDRFVLPCYA